MVNLGHHPNIGKDINSLTKNFPETEQFLKTIKEIRDEVKSVLKKTNEMIKRKWDSKRKPETKRLSRDLVWVDVIYYNIDQPLKKLLTKWLGPFLIIQKISKLAYKLKIPSIWKSIYPIINEFYFTSYMTSTITEIQQQSC